VLRAGILRRLVKGQGSRKAWCSPGPCAAGLVLAVAAPAFAGESFLIDSAHTIPSFEVKHFGITTQRGRFDHANGRAVLDIPGRKGSVSLVIDTRSIDIGSAAANRLLTSAAMLDVERFPSITFESERLLFEGERIVGAVGILTLAGVAKPVTVTVNGFSCRTHPLIKRRMCGGDISATLRRSEFGLTGFMPDIGDVVRIDVPVESIAETGALYPRAEQSSPQSIELRSTKAAGGEPSVRNSGAIPEAPSTGDRFRNPSGSFSHF
jgi:polyisoprenoid-binding protein YceI